MSRQAPLAAPPQPAAPPPPPCAAGAMPACAGAQALPAFRAAARPQCMACVPACTLPSTSACGCAACGASLQDARAADNPIHSGWVRVSIGSGFSARHSLRWCALHSKDGLMFYKDPTCQKQLGGSFQVWGSTVERKGKRLALISELGSIRLILSAPSDADSWEYHLLAASSMCSVGRRRGDTQATLFQQSGGPELFATLGSRPQAGACSACRDFGTCHFPYPPLDPTVEVRADAGETISSEMSSLLMSIPLRDINETEELLSSDVEMVGMGDRHDPKTGGAPLVIGNVGSSHETLPNQALFDGWEPTGCCKEENRNAFPDASCAAACEKFEGLTGSPDQVVLTSQVSWASSGRESFDTASPKLSSRKIFRAHGVQANSPHQSKDEHVLMVRERERPPDLSVSRRSESKGSLRCSELGSTSPTPPRCRRTGYSSKWPFFVRKNSTVSARIRSSLRSEGDCSSGPSSTSNIDSPSRLAEHESTVVKAGPHKRSPKPLRMASAAIFAKWPLRRNRKKKAEVERASRARERLRAAVRLVILTLDKNGSSPLNPLERRRLMALTQSISEDGYNCSETSPAGILAYRQRMDRRSGDVFSIQSPLSSAVSCSSIPENSESVTILKSDCVQLQGADSNGSPGMSEHSDEVSNIATQVSGGGVRSVGAILTSCSRNVRPCEERKTQSDTSPEQASYTLSDGTRSVNGTEAFCTPQSSSETRSAPNARQSQTHCQPPRYAGAQLACGDDERDTGVRSFGIFIHFPGTYHCNKELHSSSDSPSERISSSNHFRSAPVKATEHHRQAFELRGSGYDHIKTWDGPAARSKGSALRQSPWEFKISSRGDDLNLFQERNSSTFLGKGCLYTASNPQLCSRFFVEHTRTSLPARQTLHWPIPQVCCQPVRASFTLRALKRLSFQLDGTPWKIAYGQPNPLFFYMLSKLRLVKRIDQLLTSRDVMLKNSARELEAQHRELCLRQAEWEAAFFSRYGRKARDEDKEKSPLLSRHFDMLADLDARQQVHKYFFRMRMSIAIFWTCCNLWSILEWPYRAKAFYLTKMTHWSAITLTLYFNMAAWSTFQAIYSDRPDGTHERTPWFVRVTWILQNLALTSAIGVSSAKWFTQDAVQGGDIWVNGGIVIITHGVNSLVALLDYVLFVRLPQYLVHVLLPIAYEAAFQLFTYVYYRLGGLGDDGVAKYLYQSMDWSKSPEKVLKVLFTLDVMVIPLVFVILYIAYLVNRTWRIINEVKSDIERRGHLTEARRKRVILKDILWEGECSDVGAEAQNPGRSTPTYVDETSGGISLAVERSATFDTRPTLNATEVGASLQTAQHVQNSRALLELL